jgi:hypothetical protein
VRNARFEAERAGDRLSAFCAFPVGVVGIIAIVGARKGFTIKSQPPGGQVHVLGRRHLKRWLVDHGRILDEEQVERIFEGARRSSTWG